MTVRRLIAAVLALSALLAGAGCGERDDGNLVPETDEPLYVQAVQLKRQNRFSEALTSFLKVIEKRGERAAAESHLEAGSLYLNHTKDPVAAYYHFRKYLELQPNSKQAPYVRGMVEAAKREFYRTLAAAPRDEPNFRPTGDEELSRLRRENDELRAELQVLRGGGAAMPNRTAKTIALPEESRPRAPAAIPTPVINAPVTTSPAVTRPATTTATMTQPPVGLPPSVRAPTTPARHTPTQRTGVTHTVKPKESLFSIAKQYGLKVEDLTRANGIADPNKVPAGTVLKIP